jgi:type II secretory pathway component PulF
MDQVTLDDFRAWNDQLSALVQAGVPLDIGIQSSDADLADRLKSITTTVTRRVNRGESLTEALEDDDPQISSTYRSLAQLVLHSGNPDAALEGSTRVAEAIDDSRYSLRAAFIYPLILCGFAFVGLLIYCRSFVPSLAGIYQSLQLGPSAGLRALETLQQLQPYWIILPLFLLFAWLVWRWRAGPRHAISTSRVGVARWLPFVSRTLFYEECAVFANSLAALLERGTSFEDSLRLTADTCHDTRLADAARTLPAPATEQTTESSNAAAQFPPFLRWAILESEPNFHRPRALRMAAELYQHTASRRREQFRVVAPIVVCVVIGGGVTLLYGLSLFVPMVELLRTLALPPH